MFTGAAIIVAALATLLHAPIDRQLRDWKLLPEPERLTELYFTHPNNLPDSYVPGQPQTVSFTVHNLEYRTTDYHYQIIELNQDGSQSVVVADSSFTLAQDQYKSPALNITPTDLGQHVKVEVRLQGQNESIDYLINKEGA